MHFTELKGKSEWTRAYKVMAELRPEVPEADFFRLCEEAAAADQYTLLGAFDGDELIGVMGYRRLHDLVHGEHLYIDDLVVTEGRRGQGIGRLLLIQAEEAAKSRGIKQLRLCTGGGNAAGMRFYEREGWLNRAVVFKKKL
jgi:GNAT superfamily N-acetyltransferase